MRPGLTTQPSHVFLLVVLAASGLTVLGCAMDPGDVAREHADTTYLPAELGLPAPRIERASMSGSGCPDADAILLSGQRNTFLAEPDAFVVTTSAQTRQAEATCTVALTLSAPDGISYAPAGMNVTFTTDATSEVMLTTDSAWSSTPDLISATSVRVATRGRRTTSRVLDDENLWSPCSGPRTLQVTTRLHIRSDRGRAGYAVIHELSSLQFRAKRCTPDEPPPARDSGPPRPHADAPTIADLGLLGGGCSGANAAEVLWADERRSFELRFRAFAAHGPSQIQNCTASIVLTSPPGYRATIDSYVLEGQSSLPTGATATLDSSYWYPGDFSVSAQENSQTFTYLGPRQGSFVARAHFPSDDFAFGDCSQGRITFSLDAMVGSVSNAAARVEVHRLHSLKFKLQACR